MAASDPEFRSRLAKLELLIFDVDGVLTDNSLFMGTDGVEFKRFDIIDGMRIVMALRAGLRIAFVSGRPSPATTARASELGVTDVIQKPASKVAAYRMLKEKYNLTDDQVAFMGDEIVDVKVMEKAGMAFSVPGAYGPAAGLADYITSKRGGYGAAGEIIEMVLEAKGIELESLVNYDA